MKTSKERLLAHRLVDEATGCWLWTGYKDKDGYGRIRFMGRTETAHRIAAWLWLDYDLDQPLIRAFQLWVLHKPMCKNKDCFNPEHLYLGDAQANAADADMKRYSQRSLTDEQVNLIRDLLDQGMSCRAIVKQVDFKTNPNMVNRIGTGQIYVDVKREK